MPTPSAPPTPKGRSERRKSEPSGEHVRAGAAYREAMRPQPSALTMRSASKPIFTRNEACMKPGSPHCESGRGRSTTLCDPLPNDHRARTLSRTPPCLLPVCGRNRGCAQRGGQVGCVAARASSPGITIRPRVRPARNGQGPARLFSPARELAVSGGIKAPQRGVECCSASFRRGAHARSATSPGGSHRCHRLAAWFFCPPWQEHPAVSLYARGTTARACRLAARWMSTPAPCDAAFYDITADSNAFAGIPGTWRGRAGLQCPGWAPP
jgi:hypothetical protein